MDSTWKISSPLCFPIIFIQPDHTFLNISLKEYPHQLLQPVRCRLVANTAVAGDGVLQAAGIVSLDKLGLIPSKKATAWKSQPSGWRSTYIRNAKPFVPPSVSQAGWLTPWGWWWWGDTLSEGGGNEWCRASKKLEKTRHSGWPVKDWAVEKMKVNLAPMWEIVLLFFTEFPVRSQTCQNIQEIRATARLPCYVVYLASDVIGDKVSGSDLEI